jgi:hypothetical protein
MFPALEGDAFEDLVNDIAINGQEEDIVTLRGLVLDGRNRLRACERLGITPRFQEWTGKGSPIAWVLSRNLYRRHLTTGQRSLLAARAAELLEAEAKYREKLNQFPHALATSANLRSPAAQGKSAQTAAKAANVSARSVEMAKTVLRDGTEQLQEAVKAGKMAVSRAAKLAGLSAEEQVKAIAREASRAAREERHDNLREALGAGGRQLEIAMRALEKAAKYFSGYDMSKTIGSNEKTQSFLAEDAARLLARR